MQRKGGGRKRRKRGGKERISAQEGMGNGGIGRQLKGGEGSGEEEGGEGGRRTIERVARGGFLAGVIEKLT